LLVVGDPFVPFLVALPTTARRRFLARAVGAANRPAAWRAVARPSVAFALHAVTIWAWHLPALFQQTLTSDAVHGAQHLSFLATAALFWWSLFDASACQRVAQRFSTCS
jgi:cytochrome c oxidase assembly factor CtaG